MIKPDYYPLKKAAELLACNESDLLHLGANGKLQIAALLGGRAITKQTVIDSNGAVVSVSFGGFPSHIVKIERGCIQDHEAGLQTPVILGVWHDGKGGNSELLTILKQTDSEAENLSTADELMMSEVKLVIFACDLKRLQESEPQAEDVVKIGAGKNGLETTKNWKQSAREIGETWMIEQRKEGKAPGVIEIAKHVEGEMSKRNITGTRGKFLDFETIKREALTGITGRPANGKGQKKRNQTGESPV